MKKSHLIGFLFLFIFCLLDASAIAQSTQTCVKPFTIPDRWIETSVPPNNTFTMFDNQGTRLPNPDGYYAGPNGTGYNALDKGLQLVLNASEGTSIAASSYYPLALPDSTGGSDYRANISNCSLAEISLNDLIPAAPGNKTGPTKQGVQDLINLDPGAYWNTATNSVANSTYPVSPRVMMTALFDPAHYDQERQSGGNTEFLVSNFIGLFVEAVRPEGIVVRIVPIAGPAVCGDGICDSPAGEDCRTCVADCPAPPNTICL